MAPTLHLGRRARLAIKIGGFVVLGLVAFVFSLQATFDYDRVKDKYLVEGLASSYEVTVGKTERGIMPGTFTMSKVTLKSRTTKPDEVAQIIFFDKIEADVGVLGLIGGNLNVDFEASIGKGTLTGTVSFGFDGKSFSIAANGSRINGDAIPQLKDWIGLPLLGKIDLGVTVAVANNDWRKANGSIQIACPKGCTLGDGVTKFKPRVKNQRSATMVGDGIEWGRVEIDKMLGKLELKSGKLDVTKWEFESKDAELHVELELKLGKKFKESELVSGCFRYKALPALQGREPKTANAITIIGGLLGPDGLFHVKLECQGGGAKCLVANIKAKGRVCSGDSGGDDSGSDIASGKTSRTPSLGTITTGSAALGSAAPPTTEPGADISPVPVFYDAAPAEPPGSGSGAGSAGTAGSSAGTIMQGLGSAAGSNGSGEGGAAPPMLAPGPPPPPPPVEQPPPTGQEPPIESPPPVGQKENE